MQPTRPGARRPRGEPRTFTPPKQRHHQRRPRPAIAWPPPDWRARVPPALLRAGVAIGFLTIPSFEERFGAATLALACVGLAVLAGILGFVLQRSEAAETAPLALADALTLVLAVPVGVVSSGIAVADPQLGGGSARFVASVLAMFVTLVAVMLVAGLAARRDPRIVALALLPGPLVTAALVAGASEFAAGAVGEGLSAAWMFAALATLLDGLVWPRHRALIPVTAFALFAVVVAVLGRAEATAQMNQASTLVALLATAAAGVVLVIAPGVAEGLHEADTRQRAAEVDDPLVQP